MPETINYAELMSPADIKLAKDMSKFAREHGEGKALENDIKLGMSLLCGRKIAMQLAGTEVPEGRTYADHFTRWKEQFGYPIKKDWTAYYSACIYCADHFDEAKHILGTFSIADKLKMGIHGLFKRTREYVNESEGKPRKERKNPKDSPQKVIRDQQSVIANLEEELAAAESEDTLFLLEPDEIAIILAEKLSLDKLKKLVAKLVDYINDQEPPAAKPKRSKKPKPAKKDMSLSDLDKMQAEFP